MDRFIIFLLFALSCLSSHAQAPKTPQRGQLTDRGKVGERLISAINKNLLQEANILADEYLALCTNDDSQWGIYYAEAKQLKATAAAAKSDYTLAIQILDEVITARLDKRSRRNDERLGESYYDRGKYYSKLKNIDQAIADMQAAADAYLKANSKINYAAALCQKAEYHKGRGISGDIEQIAECYKKALPYAEKSSVSYFNIIAWMIGEYNNKGEYKKANLLFKKTAKREKGENPIRYADFLGLVSESEAKVGHYSDALTHAKEAFAIYEKENEFSSRNYAYLLKNAGDCFFNQLNYQDALAYYEQALKELIKVDGEKGKEGKIFKGCERQIYATNVWLGKVDQAHDYLVKLELHINEASDTTTLDYANDLATLANGKADIGIYNEAVSWGERALRRYEARGDTRQQVNMLYYLSGYYTHIGEHLHADSLNTIALQICQQQHDFTKETANLLHQKAQSFYWKREYQEANITCQQAISQLRKSDNFSFTTYATILCDRAVFLYKLDSISAAINLTREALNQQTRILGPNHDDNVTLLFNLAIYYFNIGQMDSVAYYYHDAIRLQTDLVRNNFSLQSSRQREHFWQRKSYLYKVAPLFASDSNKEASPGLLSDIYNTQLFTKGILLNSEIEFRRLLENSSDKDLLNRYDELQAKRAELSKYYERPEKSNNPNISQLQNGITQLEYDIIRKNKEFGDFTQNLKLTYDSVRCYLRPNEAAIEFVEANVTLNNKPDQIYIALVLRPNWEAPHVCQLFFQSEMEELGYPANKSITQLLSEPSYQNMIYNDSKLGQFVWEKLLQELDNVTDIYFAPSGIFYQWGIEYMPISSEGKRISDTLKISRLSSTKLLAQRRNKLTSLKDGEAVIFGGMDYDMSLSEMRKNQFGKEEIYESFSELEEEGQIAAEEQAGTTLTAIELSEELQGANTAAIREMTRYGEMVFVKLKGASNEAEAIERLLRDKGIKAKRYGAYGTEGALKALSGHKVSMLHIATHGFTFPVTENDHDWLKPSASSPQPTDPLCYSGLVFAGCNQKTLNAEDFPSDIKEDGILTAQEIAQLNLQNFQLTVLSACQTGMGTLQEDGVFGVQRGFKKAGAHTLVMSLWSVDDAATQLMMTSFYEALLSGQSRHEAFLTAQNAVRAQYPDPHYWAPFIMLDDI